MHKGLYWSQLITGVGVGLMLSASVWIVATQFATQQVTPATVTAPTEREIVFYNNTDLYLDIPEIIFYEPIEIVEAGQLDANAVAIDGKPGEGEIGVEPDILEGVALIDLTAVTVEEVDGVKVYKIWVNPGESAETIANRLHKARIVDGKEFLTLLHKMRLDRKLKTGQYTIKEGASISEVIYKFMR